MKIGRKSKDLNIPVPLPAEVRGNQVRILVNGDEALPVMLSLIAAARESIRWQVMLFFPDEPGRELAGALAAAAQRGVRVQLSFNIDQTVNGTIAGKPPREVRDRWNREMHSMLRELRMAGVEVRANPAGIDFHMAEISPAEISPAARQAQAAIRQHIFISPNHYDHRKLLIFDGDRAIIGGMNVGSHYLYHIPPDLTADMVEEARQRRTAGQPEAWEKWLDTSFLLEGPVVADVIAEFDWKWEVLGGKPLPTSPSQREHGGIPVQFLRQRPGLPQVGTRFFELVDSAQQEIMIASPFVSYDPAVRALQEASRRDVRVLFYHPRARQEMPISRRIFMEYEKSIVESGIELYYNDLRMVHTKLMVVDGKYVLIGSFNLNHRSFRHDLEVAAVVEDEALARQVIDLVFLPYQTISHRVQTPAARAWNPIIQLLKPFS